MELLQSSVSERIYYIMKDGIEIGEMVLSGDNWMIRLHRSVTSMEYHWVWLVTQDRIAQLAYYQKQRNL